MCLDHIQITIDGGIGNDLLSLIFFLNLVLVEIGVRCDILQSRLKLASDKRELLN